MSEPIKWRVDETCPAPLHNTQRAALGRGPRDSKAPRCICPHALEIFAVERKRQQERERVRKAKRRTKTKLDKTYDKLAHIRSQPDLTGGLCLSPGGQKIMGRAMGDESTHDEKAAARLMCRGCPMLRVCDNWVLNYETPAGSWPGIYAGRGPYERKSRGAHVTADGGVGTSR